MSDVRIVIWLLGLSMCGCSIGPATSHSDAGTDGGSACDDKGSCTDCVNCTEAEICASEMSACGNDASCQGLAGCLNYCGALQSCQTECYLGNPNGVALYNTMMDCVYCDACPSDCSGYRTCE
jgi:hypothetical protein